MNRRSLRRRRPTCSRTPGVCCSWPTTPAPTPWPTRAPPTRPVSSGRPNGARPSPPPAVRRRCPIPIRRPRRVSPTPVGPRASRRERVRLQAALILPGAATRHRRGWGPDLCKGDSLPLTILNMQTLTTLLTAQAGGVAVIMDRADVASIVESIRARAGDGVEQAARRSCGPWCTRQRSSARTWPPWRRCGWAEPTARTGCDGSSRTASASGCVAPTASRRPPPWCASTTSTGLSPRAPAAAPSTTSCWIPPAGRYVWAPGPTAPSPAGLAPALGYWNRPEASAGVITDRSLLTGDLGR